MVTAADLIADAFQRIQVYAPGEPVQPADQARGLSSLNQLLDQWSNMSLACYAILEQSAVLVPGQGAYQIGIGAPDFNMIRPLKILTDPGTAYVMDDNGNRYYMSVVPRDRWNLFGNVSEQINSDFPNALFYDPQFPFGVINVTPFPTIGYTMFWDSYLQFADFSSPNVPMTLPPGYELAISTNLATMLASYYPDAVTPPLLVKLAMDSLGNIKRTNQRELVAIYDSEIVSKSNVGYSVYTDTVGNAIPGIG